MLQLLSGPHLPHREVHRKLLLQNHGTYVGIAQPNEYHVGSHRQFSRLLHRVVADLGSHTL